MVPLTTSYTVGNISHNRDGWAGYKHVKVPYTRPRNWYNAMAFIPVPDVAQFNVRGTINGIPMENVLNFVKDTPAEWVVAELNVASLALRQAWQDHILDVLSVEYEALTVYARDLTSASGAVSEVGFLPGSVGIVTGDSLPGNVAACITHRTGRAGRSFRGRTFIGGLAESSTLLNNLTDAYATTLIDAWRLVIDDMKAVDFIFVIPSRFTNNAPRTTGIYTQVDSSVLRDQRVDSQRRRLS